MRNSSKYRSENVITFQGNVARIIGQQNLFTWVTHISERSRERIQNDGSAGRGRHWSGGRLLISIPIYSGGNEGTGVPCGGLNYIFNN